MDGPQEFLADLDRRWLGRPGYLTVELGALLALATSTTQGATGVEGPVLRLCVVVATVGAMALGVVMVYSDQVSRDRQNRLALIFLLATLGLAVGLLIASNAGGIAPADPSVVGVLAMITGFYVEYLRTS